MEKTFVHPYMPNSVPEIRQQLLDELGVKDVKEIYGSIIPEELLYKERLDLPEPIRSEYELKRHVTGLLNKNISTEEYTSFLGAGCYKHQVPAVCDEINMRGEFLTAYCGDTYSDHGKMQAIFEYTSMMGELLDADVVSYTTYDAGQSVCSAFRMAVRIQSSSKDSSDEDGGKDRTVILVPDTMNPEVYSQAVSYCRNVSEIIKVGHDECGLMDLKGLEEQLEEGNAAAVFYENPSYLGFFEPQAEKIAELAHRYGAVCIAQPQVSALGIMESPMNLGADIVCGDIQPLGMHMQYGGGQAGFIASHQKLEYMEQFPTYMYGIAKTDKEDTYGWGRAMNYRCSHGSREKANEYFGTETGLWGITAGVYLASMGPQGMYELGEAIIQNLKYLTVRLNEIEGVRANPFGGSNFQEVLVDFSETGKSVADIHKKLLEYGIFGGKDVSREFPWLGACGLYCVSELTTQAQMDALIDVIRQIAAGKSDVSDKDSQVSKEVQAWDM